MKLLFLTPYLPGPPLFGGARRIRGLMTELAKSHQVSLLALVDPAVDQAPAIEAAQTYCERVETVADRLHEVEGKAKRVLQLGSVLSWWSWERLLYLRPAFQRALDEHLDRHAYDVLIAEFAFMAGFEIRSGGRGGARPLLVLDEHNIEYDLLRRTAQASSLSRRAFHEVNWRKLKREEVAAWKRFDGCALTSVRDQELLLSEHLTARTAVVPNGVDVDSFVPASREVEPMTLLFFGAINYYPNTDGALFFVQEVLPLVRRKHPSVRLRIVGPVAEGPVTALRGDGVDVTGFVDDVQVEIASAAVVVVPLRIGGGTRLKILEAMAMGKAVVSTRLGAEGIEVEHDRDILLADEPADLAHEIDRVLRDPALRERLGTAARETVVERYSWRTSASKMEAFFERLAPAVTRR